MEKVTCVVFFTYNTRILNRGGRAVEQVVACALVTQRARVRSPVGTSFLGEVFPGFSSPVRQMSGSFRPPRSPNAFGYHYHPYSFITGTNDLRCWRALKHQIYILPYTTLHQTSTDPAEKSNLPVDSLSLQHIWQWEGRLFGQKRNNNSTV